MDYRNKYKSGNTARSKSKAGYTAGRKRRGGASFVYLWRSVCVSLTAVFARVSIACIRGWRSVKAFFTRMCVKTGKALHISAGAAGGVFGGVAGALVCVVVLICVLAASGGAGETMLPLPEREYMDESLTAGEQSAWQVVEEETSSDEELAAVIEAIENSGEVTTQIKYGYTGPEVAELQSRLMELDYMDNDEPTEYYGPQTRHAVELFQRKHLLQEDGIVGEVTKELIFSPDAKVYTVSVGIRGTDVLELQKRLKELGYISKATSYFGTDTEAAVKAFQKRNGLSQDGNVGPITRDVLYSSSAKSASGKSGVKASVSGSGTASALIEEARSHLGSTYVRGGKGPNVFDCSGFVYYCLNQIGVKIGYMTSSMWANASNITYVSDWGDLQKGDIICVTGHVGIYMGGGSVIDASSGQGCIRVTNFGNWWKNNWICARRVL